MSARSSDVDIEIHPTRNGGLTAVEAREREDYLDHKFAEEKETFEQYIEFESGNWAGDTRRAALALWKAKVKDLEEEGVRVRMGISTTRNEWYQMVGYFIVFAGVMFTAVSTSNTIKCQHAWAPSSLLLFTMFILTPMTFTKFRKLNKLKVMKKSQKKQISENQGKIKAIKKDINSNPWLLEESSLRRLILEKPMLPQRQNHLWLMGITTTFTVMMVASFFHILC